MTFSIIARDPQNGALGVASATGKLAVGAQVPHLRLGIGALATQGMTTNPLYAEDGLRLLQADRTAKEVVDALTARDRGRAWRQVIVIDRQGRTAGFTGDANDTVLGVTLGQDLALAGNMLANEQVLPAMQEAYQAACGRALAERLLAALDAGAGAGGDKRGACSAALLVDDGIGWPLSLRIDFADQPVDALEQLYARSREPSYQNFRNRLPDRFDPHRR
jgi:uncharacterized Ntn-hydrolase superfamily protein